MRHLLAVLAVLLSAAPIAAHGAFFQATADGCFDTYRSVVDPGGYSNAGAAGIARIEKFNQAMGWLSFYGATADGTGTGLGQFLASHPGATATLYVRSATTLMPAGSSGAYLLSLRTGNQGAPVEDGGLDTASGWSNLPAGFDGATEPVAWRSRTPVQFFGDGIGEAWRTPSTRLPGTGLSPFKWGPNQEVKYDTGVMRYISGGTPTGVYSGYFPDTLDGGGRNYWAFEDVLGLGHNARAATEAGISSAGQILAKDSSGNPLVVNNSLYVGSDPRRNAAGNWLAIPIDAAFLADMANNPEHKGLVFANNFSGLAADYSSPDYYTKEYAGGLYAPYLFVTPEPATMALLAAGGAVMLRRRSA